MTRGATNLDTLIREVLREEVRAEIRRLGLDAVALKYSTHALPPDCRTVRGFHFVCRSGRVVDAVKIGRTWECGVAAWRKARTRARPVQVVPKGDSDDALVEAALARIRGRATR